jgi:hypothetical protein
LISSAIGYVPPADGVTTMVDLAGRLSTREVYSQKPKLYEGQGVMFKNKKPGISAKFANRNNFIEFEVCCGCRLSNMRPILVHESFFSNIAASYGAPLAHARIGCRVAKS